MRATQSDLEIVTGLEHHRCELVSAGDLTALAALLHVDLTHVHASGRSQRRPEYLDGLRHRPRATCRLDLHVRLMGDTALLTGLLSNTFRGAGPAPARSDVMFATQVWVREEGSWSMIAFAASGPVLPTELLLDHR